MLQRGRKVGVNGEETRALLLKIAADEFAQNGYHETKISTIVKKGKLTQPTFYLYFQSKKAIFKELVELFQYNLFTLTKKSRLHSGLELDSIPERISYGLTNIFTFLSENPSLTVIGFYLSPESENIKKQMALQIEENLKSEVEDGYFNSKIDLSVVAESLVGIIERLTVTKLFYGEEKPEHLAREIVEIFLNGIQVSKVN